MQAAHAANAATAVYCRLIRRLPVRRHSQSTSAPPSMLPATTASNGNAVSRPLSPVETPRVWRRYSGNQVGKKM